MRNTGCRPATTFSGPANTSHSPAAKPFRSGTSSTSSKLRAIPHPELGWGDEFPSPSVSTTPRNALPRLSWSGADVGGHRRGAEGHRDRRQGAALAAVGLDAPEVVLVDRSAVAGNWSGRQGYTTGSCRWGRRRRRMSAFHIPIAGARSAWSPRRWRSSAGNGISWHTAGTPIGSIAEGCGRRTGSGLRTFARSPSGPKPRSSAASSSASTSSGDRWRLAVEGEEAISADGVVFTGSGPPIKVAGQPREHPRVFDGRSYWLHERALKAYC